MGKDPGTKEYRLLPPEAIGSRWRDRVLVNRMWVVDQDTVVTTKEEWEGMEESSSPEWSARLLPGGLVVAHNFRGAIERHTRQILDGDGG